MSNVGRHTPSVYPEPQARSGMAARAPIQFNVPIVTLTLLLSLPIYTVAALLTIVSHSPDLSRTTIAAERVLLITGLMVMGVIGIIMLIKAYRIVVRNCAHPLVIGLLYCAVVAPVSFITQSIISTRLSSDTLATMLLIEAAVIGGLTLLLTIFARFQTR